MHLWCENCREKTQTLAGKYDINICQQCGCEVRGMQEHLLAMQHELTEADASTKSEAADNQTHPEKLLTTAKYLPESFYEEESQLADDIASLDESWPEEDLIEKIQRLEASLRPVSIDDKLKDGSSAPAEKQIRIDMGHVATQRDINLARPGANDKLETVAAGNVPALDPISNLDKPLPMARKLGEVREVRIDQGEIPVAEPTSQSVNVTSSQATSLGLVATWSVQLLVGIAFAPMLPAAVWGVWLFAQVAGSICLCVVLYNLFATEPKPKQPRKATKSPIGSSLSRARQSMHG